MKTLTIQSIISCLVEANNMLPSSICEEMEAYYATKAKGRPGVRACAPSPEMNRNAEIAHVCGEAVKLFKKYNL
jgi:hypothetical protein